MRKTILFLSICIAVSACSNSNTDSSGSKDTSGAYDEASAGKQSEVDTNLNNIGTGDPAPANTEYEKGKQLISKSDCLSCHKEDVKLVGPAYNEVAKKYEFNDKNIEYLAGKIIAGGKGVWGEIPMTPHPNVPKADAEEMARYVLSLETN